jgi:hypothetical protein
MGTRPVVHTQTEGLKGVAVAVQPPRKKRGSPSLRSHLRQGRSSAPGGDSSASAAKSWGMAGARGGRFLAGETGLPVAAARVRSRL